MLECRIEKKEKIQVIGKATLLLPEECPVVIPELWTKHQQSEDIKNIVGMYGVLFNCGEKMEYTIADDLKDIDGNYVIREIPESTWAVFPCYGALPDSLQNVNDQIWTHWVKENGEYEVAGDCVVEKYTPLHENPEDDYCEIWIQVKKRL